MSENFALFPESFGHRIKESVLDFEKPPLLPPSENKARRISEHLTPFEITSMWILAGFIWKCRGRRLYKIGGIYQVLPNEPEFELYHATAMQPAAPPQGVGERVFALFRGVWEIVSSTPQNTAPQPPPEIPKVPIFYPARQIHPAAENPSENKLLWTQRPAGDGSSSDSSDPFYSLGTWYMHACGLTDEGTEPMPVMEIAGGTAQRKDNIYYQDVHFATVTAHGKTFAQRKNDADWQLLFSDGTEVPDLSESGRHTTGFVSSYLWLSYLASLEGQALPGSMTKVDYSDQWETTDDPAGALKMGNRVVAGHTIIGYSFAGEREIARIESTEYRDGHLTVSFEVLITTIKETVEGKPILGEAGERPAGDGSNTVKLYKMTLGTPANGQTPVTKTLLNDIDDVNNTSECIYAVLPDYQNGLPVITNSDSIEQNCGGILIGLWHDGTFPQVMWGGTIPPGRCLLVSQHDALVRINCGGCSPVVNVCAYDQRLRSLGIQKIFAPLNVDYKPSIRCQ